ncbi:hypothetical protein V8E36_000789 [Tilletia maclaganii]
MATNGAPWTSEVIASMQADIRACQAQASASTTTGGDTSSAPAPGSTSSSAAAGAQSAPAPPRPLAAQGRPISPPPSPSATGHRHSPQVAAAAVRPLTPPAPGARPGSTASAAQGPVQPAGYDNLLQSFARLTPSSRERLLADVAALGRVPAPGEAPQGGAAAAADSRASAVEDTIGSGPYSRALDNLAGCEAPAPSHSAGKRVRDSAGLATGSVAPFYRRTGPRPASHAAALPATASAPAIGPTSVVRHATAFVPGTTLTSAIERPSAQVIAQFRGLTRLFPLWALTPEGVRDGRARESRSAAGDPGLTLAKLLSPDETGPAPRKADRHLDHREMSLAFSMAFALLRSFVHEAEDDIEAGFWRAELAAWTAFWDNAANHDYTKLDHGWPFVARYVEKFRRAYYSTGIGARSDPAVWDDTVWRQVLNEVDLEERRPRPSSYELLRRESEVGSVRVPEALLTAIGAGPAKQQQERFIGQESDVLGFSGV